MSNNENRFEQNGKVYVPKEVNVCEGCAFEYDEFACGSVECGEYIKNHVIWVEENL